MQGEDDLRALAKIMGFIRSVSILMLFIHFYWYCYSFFLDLGWTLELINKILFGFQEKSGLFHHWSYSKLFSLLLLAISCFGTKGVKNEKIKWSKIITVLACGLALFFLNYPLLYLDLYFGFGLYIISSSIGFILMMVAGAWMSRLLYSNLMDDVFNNENESFMQETTLMENEYSINLPTKFYYKKKWNHGWINIVNPFRATIVLGTPGSGKSYAVINNYIRQHIEKGFSMYIYDFKFDDLSTIAYNHLLHHIDKYEVKPKFYVINFDDPHPLSLLGTQVLIESLGHVVLGIYKDGQSAWNSIKILKPDFVILDISMPEMSGLDVAEKIRIHQLPTKIILLTSHKEKSIFQKAEELEINAYLLKQYALDELRDCVKHLLHNEKYFSRKINFDLEKDSNYIKGEVLEQLSFSERKVFEFIIEQKTTKEIAALLFLSDKTIEAHRAAIIHKLGLESKKKCVDKFCSSVQRQLKFYSLIT